MGMAMGMAYKWDRVDQNGSCPFRQILDTLQAVNI